MREGKRFANLFLLSTPLRTTCLDSLHIIIISDSDGKVVDKCRAANACMADYGGNDYVHIEKDDDHGLLYIIAN